jgi:hypothetical protein
MKSAIRHVLNRCGIYHTLSHLRQLPAAVSWLSRGCQAPAPQAVKMRIVERYLREYNLRCLIETGTYLGDTVGYLSTTGIECLSIELCEHLHRQAMEFLAHRRNVTLIHGDSREMLPGLLAELDKPALFWLDGHYSGEGTAQGAEDSPIDAEIEAILKHPISSHVVLIDDARCFRGTKGYPHLDQLLRRIREEGRYDAEVSADIIRLVPRQPAGALEGRSCC